MIELRQWNVVEHLNTQEDMVLYLKACREENDPAHIHVFKAGSEAKFW